jgi:hypothetical protein
LFARQCHLLKRLGQPLKFFIRAHSFINTFSGTLKDYKVSLIPFFRESWIYSACMSVVNSGDELMSKIEQHDQPTLKQYEALKASVLHLARIQVSLFVIYLRNWGYLTCLFQGG